jgi:hypothetical protein
MGYPRKSFRILLENITGKWPLGRSMRWEDNIKINMGEKVLSVGNGWNQFMIVCTSRLWYRQWWTKLVN